jgi:hypothetical protein
VRCFKIPEVKEVPVEIQEEPKNEEDTENVEDNME